MSSRNISVMAGHSTRRLNGWTVTLESLDSRITWNGSAWVTYSLIMQDSGEYLQVRRWQEDVDLNVATQTTLNIPDRSTVLAINTRVITALTGTVGSFGVGVSGDTSRYGNGIRHRPGLH